MSVSFLVDTNVLVYLYDRSEPKKQEKALKILDHLYITGLGALSTQVLAEFFVGVTRKIASPLPVERVLESLQNLAASWNILEVSRLIVLEAARGVRDHQFSYFDAQIWATARLNQISVVLSEDFNPSLIEGVRFVNPFEADFKIEAWV